MIQPSVEKLKDVYVYSIPSTILAHLQPQGQSQIDNDLTYADENVSSDEDEYSGDEHGDEGHVSAGVASTTLQDTAQDIRGSKGSPIFWFTSSMFPAPTKLGIFKAIVPTAISTVQSIQLGKPDTPRSMAMFMVGGGHFQGAVISLDESSTTKCAIKATKGFHRYTTRRKQGGAQSANDNAKGAAKSAGAQIRRYNEIALAEDVRELLKEWSEMLRSVEVILIRASGQSSKKLLFDNGLDKQDPRVRGFPLNTRRATQSEIVRSFHTLTRLQVGSSLDDVVSVKPHQPAITKSTTIAEEQKPDALLVEHTDKLMSLIKRSKAPAMRAYLSEHHIDVCAFRLEPRKTYLHAPSLLHYASTSDTAACIAELLTSGADPTQENDSGKTPFEVAGSKKTRDAFRIWRGMEGHEERWDWDAAKVPVGLTAQQVAARQAREAEEKAAEDKIEQQRRQEENLKLENEAKEAREAELREAERKRGPARSLALGVLGSSTSTSLDGLTPQMRQKIERERRARAAEARFKK